MKTKEELINTMIVSGVLKTTQIIDAFEKLDRKYFVPASLEKYVYEDVPLSIGNNQTISQPSTVAFMLEQLEVQKGHHVLDIGSGSGWTTALLCDIVGEEGSVIGLERVDALLSLGKVNLAKCNFKNPCHIEKAGDRLGMPNKQFDRILVSASAEEIPEELFKQLVPGGILIIPIKDAIYRFKKRSEFEVTHEMFYGFRFVPLVY
ncbi:MAG TPA: protein-L-isoaspartate O-methyltransferase [Sulfurovum sp.]|nr:protein-L-isoaspartate O-methyltransferase [Sulfurovum sp.]